MQSAIEIARARDRQLLAQAENNFGSAFERLMEHTDLQRCMDVLGCVLERRKEECRGSVAEDSWDIRAKMLFELGKEFQDMG